MPVRTSALGHSPDPRQTAPSSSGALTGKMRRQILIAALVLIVVTLGFVTSNFVIRRTYPRFALDVFYSRAVYRFHLALAGTFAIAWLLQPSFSVLLDHWRGRLPPRTRRTLAIAAVAFACMLSAAFVNAFGHWQFGGFDYNILLEIGWRQILGQRPYVDFPTTSPPLFNLGIWLAFRLFGVSWDAMLFFTALFTAGTLAWLYLLFRRHGMGRFPSLGVASTIEAAAMLTCCFWWYNNTTLVLAALFFLSSLLLLRSASSRLNQGSFVISLALLSLAKPNIAGLTIVGCLCLLLLAAENRRRIVFLTLAATALSLAIFAVGHISIPAMLASYHGAAKERGALSSFGFAEYRLGEQELIVAWYLLLFLPLLSIVRPLRSAIRAHAGARAIAPWLFYPLGVVIAIYGLLGNGELRDMETSVLVCGIALLAFSMDLERPQVRRFTGAILSAMLISNLYTGAARHRVYTVGSHLFFEWQDRDHLITSGPLKNMRVSQTLIEVNHEIHDALKNNAGPYFFGTRIDYNYMAQGLPSPKHFPAWFHPGTAFDRALLPQILSDWQKQRFTTLVFYKDDYTYYPKTWLEVIHRDYARDDRYPRLTVYHRRPGL